MNLAISGKKIPHRLFDNNRHYTRFVEILLLAWHRESWHCRYAIREFCLLPLPWKQQQDQELAW